MSSVASFYELQAEKPSGAKIDFAVSRVFSGSVSRVCGKGGRVLTPCRWIRKDYKGHVVLCVNTATKCGFTRMCLSSDGNIRALGPARGKSAAAFPRVRLDCSKLTLASFLSFAAQFTGLEELYQKYKDQGLIVLGFPSDQFGHQNPEDDTETGAICLRNHGVTFPLLKKSDVNGDKTNEVFKFLKPRAKGLLGERVNWNFTKFLVSKRGEVLHRYAPTTKPQSIAADIEKALAESV